MQISVSHSTRYRFDVPPAHGLQRLRLKPKANHGQGVIDWDMTVEGAAIEATYEDHNNNNTVLVSFAPDTLDIVVTCEGLIETADNAGILGPHIGFLPLWAFLNQTALTQPGPLLRALVAPFRGGAGDRLEKLHGLAAVVSEAVRFEIGHTDAKTTAEMALAAGQGVCQDHAHVFIAAARALDVPARYVSGYLLMDGQVEQQAGHGWAEAHVDGLGWVGFDVANAICPDQRYVRVASGRDYRDAAPVTGIALGPGSSALSVRLSVDAHGENQSQRQSQRQSQSRHQGQQQESGESQPQAR